MAVNIIPFFSPISPADVKSQMLSELREAGATILTHTESPEFYSDLCSKIGEHVFIFIGTGGSEDAFAEFYQCANLPQPIVLLSHNLHNSLPAALEIRAYLGKHGTKSRINHDKMDGLKSSISRWTQFSEIQYKLSSSRFGLVGGESSWLIASGVNKEEVQKRWGFDFVDIPLDRLLLGIENEMTTETQTLMRTFRTQADNVDASDEDLISAAKVVQSLFRIIQDEELNTVTVKCFELFEKTGITGCQSLSYLNDVEGMVAGCEGDIPSAFTMMLMNQITGQPSFMANVSDLDTENNTVVLAHCTVPTSMVTKYDITSHFETGASVAVRGTLPEEEVTVVKISGADLTDYWISSGRIVENLSNERACRTQIRVKLDESVNYFLKSSLANHHIVVFGDHSTTIKEFLEFSSGY